jgi:hypothetical protein
VPLHRPVRTPPLGEHAIASATDRKEVSLGAKILSEEQPMFNECEYGRTRTHNTLGGPSKCSRLRGV